MWGTRSLFPPQSGTGCPLCPLQPLGIPLLVGQRGWMVGKAPTQRRVPSAPPARAESCFFCSLRWLITARTINTSAWVAGAPRAGLGEPAGGGTPAQGSLSSATTQKRSMSQIPRVRASHFPERGHGHPGPAGGGQESLWVIRGGQRGVHAQHPLDPWEQHRVGTSPPACWGSPGKDRGLGAAHTSRVPLGRVPGTELPDREWQSTARPGRAGHGTSPGVTERVALAGGGGPEL